jgi:hypothetical protein
MDQRMVWKNVAKNGKEVHGGAWYPSEFLLQMLQFSASVFTLFE